MADDPKPAEPQQPSQLSNSGDNLAENFESLRGLYEPPPKPGDSADEPQPPREDDPPPPRPASASAAQPPQPTTVAAPPKPAEPVEDPRLQQIEDLWWSDNAKARELQREVFRDDAKKLLAEEREQERAARVAEERAALVFEAGKSARDVVADKYGVTPTVAEAMIQRAARHMAEYHEKNHEQAGVEGIWTVADNFVQACEMEFGAPPERATTSAAPTRPAARDIADPPGTKRSPAPPPPRRQQAPPLSQRYDRALSSMASNIGLDADGTRQLKTRFATREH